MTKTNLQLALDLTDFDAALEIAKELEKWWDIIEVGTALLLSKGLSSVEKIRVLFPEAVILADTKIIDSGRLLAEVACKSGADIVSVVSAASEGSIKESIAAARRHGKKVLLDHISVDWQSEDMVEKSKLGVDLVGLHLPKDEQGTLEFDIEAVKMISQKTQAGLSIAGGITPETIKKFSGLPIQVFVVGGYLLKAEKMKERAEFIKELILEKENDQNG